MAFQVIWSPTAKLDLADRVTHMAEFDVALGAASFAVYSNLIDVLPLIPNQDESFLGWTTETFKK